MAVELRGRAVDVYDDLVTLGIPERGRPLHEVVPDRDDEIRVCEGGDVREVRARPLETDRR